MKAAVMRAFKAPLQIEDIEIGRPGPREVLVRTVATGVCHSDLHVIEAGLPVPPPLVLGHEPAGIVEAVGADVTHVVPGRPRDRLPLGVLRQLRVLPLGQAEPLRRRGDDAQARRAAAAHEGRRADQPVRAPLVVRREDARARERAREDPQGHAARPRGADRLRRDDGARRGAQHRAVAPGSTCAVIGCGGVGLSAIQGARIAGASRIIAVDTQPWKLELAPRRSARPTA